LPTSWLHLAHRKYGFKEPAGSGFFSQLDELGAARTFGLVGTNSEEFAYVGESGAALSRHGAGIENILGLIVFFSHLGKLISAESRHTNGFIFRM